MYLFEEPQGNWLELMKQNWIYPYDYMNGFERFDENRLPELKHFYRMF